MKNKVRVNCNFWAPFQTLWSFTAVSFRIILLKLYADKVADL